MDASSSVCQRCRQPFPGESAFCPHCGARREGAPRRLTRSGVDRKIAGVCGGLAEYFDIDPTLARAGYLALTCFTGGLPGIVLYVILSVIVPKA